MDRGASLAAAAVLAAWVSAAQGMDFYLPEGEGPHKWSNLERWRSAGDYKNDVTKYTTNIKVTGKVPGIGGENGTAQAFVTLDADGLNPDTPLEVDENLRVTVSQLCIAQFAGPPYAEAGERHTVAVTMKPGSSFWFQGNKQFILGSEPETRALLTMEAGSLATNSQAVVQVGVRGEGEIRNNGGSFYAALGNNSHGLKLGAGAGGCGKYVQSAGLANVRMAWLGTEANSTGVVELAGGKFEANTVTAGHGENARGRFTVRPGVERIAVAMLALGSGEGSHGMLELYGGAQLRLPGSYPTLSVRNSAGADGELRGCGEVTCAGEDGTLKEMNFWMSGRVVADGSYAGEGVEKTLDLSKIKSGNSGRNNVQRHEFGDGFDTTNGYYAVNGATLRYPGLCNGYGSRTAGSVGDTNHDGISPLVNTIHVDAPEGCGVFSGLNTVGAKLFAADSAELPGAAGIGGAPGSGGMAENLGAWGVWLQWDVGETTGRADFNSINRLTFRYDHRWVKAGARVQLMRREEDGKWTVVAAKAHDPAAPYIGISGVTPRSGEWNIGMYAVRMVRGGMLITVK